MQVPVASRMWSSFSRGGGGGGGRVWEGGTSCRAGSTVRRNTLMDFQVSEGLTLNFRKGLLNVIMGDI